MTKKYKEQNEEFLESDQPNIAETVAIYAQNEEKPKQKTKLKVLAFFSKTNTIVFSDEFENGIELPNTNLKFKNLKIGDTIYLEQD